MTVLVENEIQTPKGEDDSTLPPSEKEHPLDHAKEDSVKPKSTWKRSLVALLVLAGLLIAAVVLGVVLTQDKNTGTTDRSSALVDGETSPESPVEPTTSNTNEQAPVFIPFADEAELQDAAIAYSAGELDESIHGPIEDWDVSQIQDFSYLFYGEDLSGVDLSRWDMSNARDIEGMFEDAAFTSDLANWDVSKVTNMGFLFSGAHSFTSDLSNWDVSNVEDFSCTFYHATEFDSDLSRWNVGKATKMPLMFDGARSFSGNIASWDIRRVTDFEFMFENSTMSQDLCAWGPLMNRTNALVGFMFNDTNCPTQEDPSLNTTTVGPLCHVCM